MITFFPIIPYTPFSNTHGQGGFRNIPFVNMHYVRFSLLSMLNKEMAIFSHGVNVVRDGSI